MTPSGGFSDTVVLTTQNHAVFFKTFLIIFRNRWKGENVATSEVADILTMAHCILEANVYGVKVDGKDC